MKVNVLASGSKGNSTYFETEKLKFLVDVGPSAASLVNSLNEMGVSPFDIQMVFLTHTHSDHVGGLRVFVSKYHPTVYLTEKMYDELGFILDDVVFMDDDFDVVDLHVGIVKTSHDVADSNGYVFSSNGSSAFMITDTGYIHMKNYDKLTGHNLYIFESNHDVKMLKEGHYPYYLQQRILSDRGHLSNKDSSFYLSKFITSNTSLVVLIHLSEENNTPELAYNTLMDTLNKRGVKIPNIIIAKQKESTGIIEI